LQTAINYALEGPLHKAIQQLEEILLKHPGEKTAALYLADVYCRLGRYQNAISLFAGISKTANWDEELEQERTRIEAIWHDLKIVETSRFGNNMFLSHAIVPDGKGGYFADTLGFPGTWDFHIGISESIPPGAYLRFLKSLAWVTEKIQAGYIQPPIGISSVNLSCNGTVYLKDDNGNQGIEVSLLNFKTGKSLWEITIPHSVLFWERDEQRKKIQKSIEQGVIDIRRKQEVPYSNKLPKTNPGVALISLGLASDYAITVLRDRLVDKGIPAYASFIRSLTHLGDYLNDYAALPELNSGSPDIFAISVLDVMIEEVCLLIALLRQRYPDAFIIVGGPTSQTPEQFAALVADFDILIKGDGDEILPEVAKIIGQKKRTSGLSENQLAALRALPGGLIIQQKKRRIVHRLDYTNIPEKYHLPRVTKKATIYYWQTSRGCPYDCRFCYKWSGKRYQMVVPWEDDPVNMSRAKRSATAMKEFLLSRLALEWPKDISKTKLEELLKKAKASGKPLSLEELKGKIFIVIEDDDFLINRERVKEFYHLVDELGLQNYFEFSAITSVRTLYRGGDTVDHQILSWLKNCNFTSLDLGSDGLCQDTIDENQKGYSLDRHVIPLNALLKEMDFFAFNNTIISTPYTTASQFVESLLFYILCPYPLNMAIEIGIMGHIGTKYTNEDIVNQQYEWDNQTGEKKGHFKAQDNYLIPINFPEYALNGSHIISYADPKVRDLILKFPKQEPLKFINEDIPKEEIDEVINSWINAPEERSEVKAIGKSIALLQSRHKHWEYDYTISTIKEEMSMLGLSSFVEYHERLKKNQIQNDHQFRWIMKKRWEFGMLRKEEKLAEAEKRLKLLVQKTPWYYRPHQELIVILGNQGKISDAVEYFTRFQVIHPDLLFYYMFYNQLVKALNLNDAIEKSRVFFHIPRYYTISPIYYFLALLKELAGGSEVKEFSFSRFSPRDVEKLYNIFDFLTIDTIKDAIDQCSFNISTELKKGNELSFMGIPVKFVRDGQQLVLDYSRIDIDAPLVIEKHESTVQNSNN
jgi:tetratricopeptide (TPR) repeat protein